MGQASIRAKGIRRRRRSEKAWLPRGAEDGRSKTKTKEKPKKMGGDGGRSLEGLHLRDHAPPPRVPLISFANCNQAFAVAVALMQPDDS